MMNTITDTVKHLLIINVLFFVGTLAIGNGELFYNWFALHFPQSEAFKPWQIITHMFMHGGFSHILFNMFALWMFGTAVEQRLGNKRFLFLYISAGLGAVLFQLGYYYYDYYSAKSVLNGLNLSNEFINKVGTINTIDGNVFFSRLEPLIVNFNIDNSVLNNKVYQALYDINAINTTRMVGASGCIMGLLAAFGMMNPNAELMMIFLPIPIKAKYFIPGIIILDIISAITGQSFFSPSNTAYMAHVGGAVTGFLIMWYWRKTQFNKHRWN